MKHTFSFNTPLQNFTNWHKEKKIKMLLKKGNRRKKSE